MKAAGQVKSDELRKWLKERAEQDRCRSGVAIEISFANEWFVPIREMHSMGAGMVRFVVKPGEEIVAHWDEIGPIRKRA